MFSALDGSASYSDAKEVEGDQGQGDTGTFEELVQEEGPKQDEEEDQSGGLGA